MNLRKWGVLNFQISVKIVERPSYYAKVYVAAIVCIGVLTPSSKTPTPLFFAKPPLLNLQISKPPFLGNPPYILVFHELPLKMGFFSESP